MACVVLAPAFAGDVSPQDIEFSINRVGSGHFSEAVLAPPAGPGDAKDPLCVTLSGGSRTNDTTLATWINSNHASSALADRPDATLTVMTDTVKGLKKGVYHLSRITVTEFVEKADPGLTNVRLDTAKVTCQGLQAPP